MHLNTLLAVLGAASQVARAAPSTESLKTDPSLRLVKTSEEDPGQWVTEDQKFERFTSKRIGFVDITDIQDKDVLSILSTRPEDVMTIQAVQYPSELGHVDEANALITTSNVDGPQSWMTSLTGFNTRHYRSTTGTQASAWVFNQVKSLASSNPNISIKQFKHSYNMPSVIAQIPGQKSNLVIIGAHMDSTAGSTNARSPGADDNASGSVTIMEAFRVIVESGFQPTNTLEFHWYSGEEGGLLGSADVFRNYKSSGKSVVGMLNQDMTGYSPSETVSVYTDYTDKALTSFVTLMAREYTGKEPTTSSCGYSCSDHGSARANGYPAAFVCEDRFENSNEYIHSSRDTVDRLSWDSVARHIKLTIGFAVEMSYV